MREKRYSNHRGSTIAVLYYDPTSQASLASAVIALTAMKGSHDYSEVWALPYRGSKNITLPFINEVELPTHPKLLINDYFFDGVPPNYDLFFFGMLPLMPLFFHQTVFRDMADDGLRVRSIRCWINDPEDWAGTIDEFCTLISHTEMSVYAVDTEREVEKDYVRLVYSRYASKLGNRNGFCKALARYAGYGDLNDPRDSLLVAGSGVNVGLKLSHELLQDEVEGLKEKYASLLWPTVEREADRINREDILTFAMRHYGDIIDKIAGMTLDDFRHIAAGS